MAQLIHHFLHIPKMRLVMAMKANANAIFTYPHDLNKHVTASGYMTKIKPELGFNNVFSLKLRGVASDKHAAQADVCGGIVLYDSGGIAELNVQVQRFTRNAPSLPH